MATAAVEVRDATKRFGTLRALDGVSLTVEEGEFFALLGPNGAGKTTLISALGGLVRPDSGELRVMGRDVAKEYGAARRLLGIVPQEVVFDPFFSVRETLELQSGYFGLRDNRAWIDELLERLALGVQGRRQHALALGRHEAPRDGGAGAGPPPAGHRARRADGRGGRGAAPDPLAVRPRAQRRRAHDRPHHALPRGGAAPVRAHRDDEGRADRGARLDRAPARGVLRARAAREAGGLRPAGVARGRRQPWTRPGGTASRSTAPRRWRARSRACARRAPAWRTWRWPSPSSRKCS